MIFLSHSSRDEQLAVRLCRALEQAGQKCWMAPRDIPAGSSWPEQITGAVQRSQVFLVLLTESSNASDHVLREVELAVKSGVRIMMCRYEKVDLAPGLEYLLSSVQGIDATRDPFDTHVQRLLESLSPAPRSPAAPTPPAWYRKWRLTICAGTLFVVGIVVVWVIGHFGSDTNPSTAQDQRDSSLTNRQVDTTPAPVALPSGVENLPAAKVLRTIYHDSPPAISTSPGQPGLSVDILAQQAGEFVLRPIGPEASLRSQIDLYKILLTTTLAGYVYVFQIDSRGNTTWLFPRNETSGDSSGSNPVAAGEIQIPGGTNALFLDQNTGVEHVFAVFSKARWTALEQCLQAAGESAAVPVAVEDSLRFVSRGVGGTRRRPAVPDRKIQYQNTELTVVFMNDRDDIHLGVGQFIVVQRKFRHE